MYDIIIVCIAVHVVARINYIVNIAYLDLYKVECIHKKVSKSIVTTGQIFFIQFRYASYSQNIIPVATCTVQVRPRYRL
jgi:hypothetical protein